MFPSSRRLFSSRSAEYKSFLLITVRRSSRLTSTTGPPHRLPPEMALASHLHPVQVEAAPGGAATCGTLIPETSA